MYKYMAVLSLLVSILYGAVSFLSYAAGDNFAALFWLLGGLVWLANGILNLFLAILSFFAKRYVVPADPEQHPEQTAP